MRYRGTTDYNHRQPPRVGVLVTNLGTPDAPEKGALRRYLREFLSDPRVVEVPRLIWFMILHGIILNVRPARSAAAYRTVWTEDGSPLLLHTRAQAEKLQARLTAGHGDAVLVEYAMRYGSHSIPAQLQSLLDRGVQRLLVLPLYPQYSGPTGGSTFDALAEDFQRRRWLPELRFVTSYHDHPAYIEALAASVRKHWQQHGRADRLMMSYHGEPQRYLEQGDPYHCQCHKTSRLLAEALGLGSEDYQTCFQSRFGREPWLQPYTDETLQGLPAQGIKSVQVICPGFSADCLETIEEIGVENRDYFLQAGGERYEYIPCLNSEPDHIDALATIIDQQLCGWLPLSFDGDASQARAIALGSRR